MKFNRNALLIWAGKIPSHFIKGMTAGAGAGAGIGILHTGGDVHRIIIDAGAGLVLAGLMDVRSFITVNPLPDIFVENPTSTP